MLCCSPSWVEDDKHVHVELESRREWCLMLTSCSWNDRSRLHSSSQLVRPCGQGGNKYQGWQDWAE